MTEKGSFPVGPDIEAGDAARAEIYTLLGTLLAGPPDSGVLELLQEIDAGDPNANSMAATWQTLQAAAIDTDVSQLGDEYFNLFIGLGRGELVPYASFYIHGFLMEKVLASLRSELQQLGIELQDGISEPEDHVAALCETMGMIISESGLSFEEQAAFFEAFIANWMPDFFADLGEAESAHFYKSVAVLGQQFMEIEAQYLAMPA
jgi:TorA maturation chaperone TorD